MTRDHDPHLAAQCLDQHVGRSVRIERRLRGMSQQTLARALGVSFQQVQKYEAGSNRISASKLFQISQILGVAVNDFFEGLGGASSGETAEYANCSGLTAQLMAEVHGQDLARAFVQIRRGDIRRRLVALAVALAEDS